MKVFEEKKQALIKREEIWNAFKERVSKIINTKT